MTSVFSTLARRTAGFLVALGALGVSGCGGANDALPSDAPTPMHLPTPSVSGSASPTPTETATPWAVAADCQHQLEPAEARALAGADLRGPRQAPVYFLVWCHWRAGGGGPKVSTMEGTMDAWRDFAPVSMLQGLASVVELSGDACELFKAMTGAMKGSTSPGPNHLLRYDPSEQRPRAVEAQQCRRGRFSLVRLTAPGLQPGPALEERVTAALAAMAD
jgi:hypothetical protein